MPFFEQACFVLGGQVGASQVTVKQFKDAFGITAEDAGDDDEGDFFEPCGPDHAGGMGMPGYPHQTFLASITGDDHSVLADNASWQRIISPAGQEAPSALAREFAVLVLERFPS